jgi:hypothetical protein
MTFHFIDLHDWPINFNLYVSGLIQNANDQTIIRLAIPMGNVKNGVPYFLSCNFMISVSNTILERRIKEYLGPHEVGN